MVEKMMEINITGSNYQELMNLFQKFPNGIIKAKNSQAFWMFNDSPPVQQYPTNYPPQNPQNANVPPLNQARGPNQPRPQEKNAFLRAFDSMAERF